MNLELASLTTMYIITGSPTSQYRNFGNMYLAQKFAQASQIQLTWVFTESGHGKGPMDGVGAAIKNSIDEAMVAGQPRVLQAGARPHSRSFQGNLSGRKSFGLKFPSAVRDIENK